MKTLSEEKKELLKRLEYVQSKAKSDEEEFKFKYDELKIELEHKFNDIVEEYSQIQNENEKKIALLDQENSFLKKENEKLYQDLEKNQQEISNFRFEIENLANNNENLQKQVADLEIKKQQELFSLKNEFEKKIKEVFYLILEISHSIYINKILEENSEPQRKIVDKNKAEAPEFLIEKTYLQNQINLLTNQLQENKRLYDGLYIALQRKRKN